MGCRPACAGLAASLCSIYRSVVDIVMATSRRNRYTSRQVVDILCALPSDEEVSEDEEEDEDDDEVVTKCQTLF